MKPRIVFLHIPKTAGQSVHSYLVNVFGSENIFPARVNNQFYQYSRSDLLKYQVFSGHFDWSILDCIPEPKFVFTILRDPVDRIVSFYLYLRREAQKLDTSALELASNSGKKAALKLAPDEYFVSDQSIRKFIDDHYDNFYTYFFAGRAYDARMKVLGALPTSLNKAEKEARTLQIAIDNMSFIKHVYSINEWQTKLGQDLFIFSGIKRANLLINDKEWKVNIGDKMTLEKRLRSILEIGATEKTFKKIRDYVLLDNQLIEAYFKESNFSLENSLLILEKFC